MSTQQKASMNVLEVLRDDFVDASLTRMHDKDAHAKAARSEDALAAVAELIEADKEYDTAQQCWDIARSGDPEDLSEEHWKRIADDYEAAIARRASALARVGGAA